MKDIERVSGSAPGVARSLLPQPKSSVSANAMSRHGVHERDSSPSMAGLGVRDAAWILGLRLLAVGGFRADN